MASSWYRLQVSKANRISIPQDQPQLAERCCRQSVQLQDQLGQAGRVKPAESDLHHRRGQPSAAGLKAGRPSRVYLLSRRPVFLRPGTLKKLRAADADTGLFQRSDHRLGERGISTDPCSRISQTVTPPMARLGQLAAAASSNPIGYQDEYLAIRGALPFRRHHVRHVPCAGFAER